MKRPKFTAARPRAEVIAEFASTPPPAAPPAKPSADAEPPADADAVVSDAIKSAKAAVQKALAAQAEDADGDAADPDVLKALEEADEALSSADEAQGEDEDKDAVTAAASTMECGRDGCGHLASAHAGEDNLGACSECSCSAMVITQLDDADGAGEMSALDGVIPPASEAPGAPETPAAEEGGDAPDLNEPPPMPDNDAVMGPAFTIPVAIIEGQPTGDGRSIAVGALDWRVPPLPLMLLATATHDPMGMDMNAPAVLAGRIDSLERVPGEGDTQIISCKGFCLNDENGLYLASLAEQMGRLGVSADVAVEESVMEITELDGDGFPIDMNDQLTKGTIMAVTACPMPAFEGAYMVMGDGTEIPDVIPQQTDETPLVASAHFMTYAECEPCQQGLEVLVASAGPARPPAAWFEDPQFTPGDGRLQRILGSDGEEKFACPLTVTEDGQVFGHIAPWDVCHTGKPGCVTAPPSACDYAHFKRGQYVVTAEGEKIRVGVLTADTTHASHALGPAAAMAHYENTGLAAADLNAGEDDFGIWVAGAIRPNATEEQIRNITAASPSGDWRMVGGQLELVAALAVPLPGFPLVVVDHASGERTAVTAAGAGIMYAMKHPEARTHEYRFDEHTARTLERLAANDARSRIAALR
jgi:hypothetical protein